MPTYADQQALQQFFSQASVTDWADKDRDGQLSSSEQQTIDQALEAAEGIVDSYLSRGGYAAPFDADSFGQLPQRLQSLIRQWTMIIAGFNLHAWRGLRDHANPFDKLYQQTHGQMTEVSSGLPLAGLERCIAVNFGFAGEDLSDDQHPLKNVKRDGWDW